MKFVGLAKGLLQVLALTAVLLTWSSIDRVFKAFTAKTNSLHVWFGAPRTPAEIHVGEIYNATVEWEAVLATRKTSLNVSMDLGLRCAGGKDGGLSYRIDNWSVRNKDGSAYVDYPMTPQDLRADLNDALCYLNIDYTYWPNTAGEPSSTTMMKDKAMSAVFKLTRANRVLPLPLATAPVLSPEDRTLSLQLRVDDTIKKPGQSGSVPEQRKLRLNQPLVRVYHYTGVSIWPEDDPEWTIDERVPMIALLKWISIAAVAYTISTNPRVRNFMGNICEKVSSWWGTDIEDPLAPRKTVRSRRRSFLRDHIPMHVA